MTEQELAAEKQREAQLNQVSGQAMQIFLPAYAKLHPYFRMAANIGQGAIPHRICMDKDGREITVYNTNLGKIVGSFLTPTHEYVSKYIAEKKYGAALGALFGGQSLDIQDQIKATCITVTPDQVLAAEPKVLPIPPPSSTSRKGITNILTGIPPAVIIGGVFLVSGIVIFGLRKIIN